MVKKRFDTVQRTCVGKRTRRQTFGPHWLEPLMEMKVRWRMQIYIPLHDITPTLGLHRNGLPEKGFSDNSTHVRTPWSGCALPVQKRRPTSPCRLYPQCRPRIFHQITSSISFLLSLLLAFLSLLYIFDRVKPAS